MPVKRCQSDGKPGWKWGDAGHCYTFTEGDTHSEGTAKQRAYIQGYAMGELSAEEEAEHIKIEVSNVDSE